MSHEGDQKGGDRRGSDAEYRSLSLGFGKEKERLYIGGRGETEAGGGQM